MLVNVLISNVVTLHPFNKGRVTDLKTGTLHTYHQTSNRNRTIWIFIDQTQDWYPKDWFKSNKLSYN